MRKTRLKHDSNSRLTEPQGNSVLLKRLWTNRDGGVAPMLALAAIPIMGFVGAAIDFSRAASVRTAMQTALDATALMLSKEAQGMAAADLQQKASNYFKANFTRPEAHDVQVTQMMSSPQEGNFTLKITGSGSIDPVFTKLLGQSQLNFSASAEVLWGIKKLNIALALDNTGSMASSGKMTALKIAAHNLLTTLQNAAKQPGDVRVAIVPFAVDVNVGTGNVDESWIDWTDWDADNGQDATTTSCTSTKTGKSGKSKKKCTTSTTWVPDNHNTWNGCITDRDKDYDIKNTTPKPADASLPPGQPSTMFPAEQANDCPAKMMGLSYDWTALKAKVDELQPDGTTNQPIGLAWAWMALTSGVPLSPPAKTADTQQAIILFSDGLNTENR